jgi:NAD(P)-dependent dehydrogenase (short-subunit alcohol dehydrogenase family)
MLAKAYSGMRAYRQSKLAQIMFTIDLARELEGTGVTVNALHPATFMNTTMVLQFGGKPLSTVEEGADAILKLATSADVEGRTGLYYNGQREAHADAQVYDAEARRQLKALSLALTGLSEKKPASAQRSHH